MVVKIVDRDTAASVDDECDVSASCDVTKKCKKICSKSRRLYINSVYQRVPQNVGAVRKFNFKNFTACTWAPATIFQRGAKPPTLDKVDTFSARRTQNRPFFDAPKAQTKILGYFVGWQHMTSFFSNSRAGGK